MVMIAAILSLLDLEMRGGRLEVRWRHEAFSGQGIPKLEWIERENHIFQRDDGAKGGALRIVKIIAMNLEREFRTQRSSTGSFIASAFPFNIDGRSD